MVMNSCSILPRLVGLLSTWRTFHSPLFGTVCGSGANKFEVYKCANVNTLGEYICKEKVEWLVP